MSSRGLPSGTVTFLFTDVEGSTRLLSELGAEAYAEALAEHRRVIREACAREGGVEVDTQGDAFFFAFPTAPGALAAAAGLTEGLAAGPIRVRVGVHTGTPLLGEEGYVGHDVHRAARIAASGHGGQVLVSASTAPLVEVELRDLGEHRFKDLSAPERVYQLGAGDFPALKTLYRTNLPVPATPFLGRETELREVSELLERPDARLVTLAGPGGTGKTRLALQAAAEAAEGFPDGVFWIPLAPLRDASLLDTTFAQALEVSEQAGVAIADSIVGAFAGRRALLVVDNCEHLVDAVADLVRRLVEGCPRLVVVGSSRERLGLRSERVYAVPPMAPTDGELLFLERARAVDSDFEPDEHVAAICEAVDELPLAIELAAARVRSLSTRAIRERLGERLSLLATRDRDVEERQRTLEATIAWSYDLLDPEEQRVLRALSVFAGGCTLEAAEVVAGADLDLLESLLDKSLIRHRIDEAGQDRYWMLETIREYGVGQTDANAETSWLVTRYVAWFEERAVRIAPENWLDADESGNRQFEADRSNFRYALSLALRGEDAETAASLMTSLAGYWFQNDELADSYRYVESALGLLEAHPVDDLTRGLLLLLAGEFAVDVEAIDLAIQRLEQAKLVFQEAGDLRRLSWTLRALADAELFAGHADLAVAYAEQASSAARRTGDTYTVMRALHGHAMALEKLDSPDLIGALELRRTFHTWAMAEGSVQQQFRSLQNMASIQLELGNWSQALGHARDALVLAVQKGLRWAYASVLAVAWIASGTGRHADAVKLMTVGVRLAKDTNSMLFPDDDAGIRQLEADAKAVLGDVGLSAAISAGQAMTLDEAVQLALSLEVPDPD
jgi:predicted ATPase/class 3 adenylate cyclase